MSAKAKDKEHERKVEKVLESIIDGSCSISVTSQNLRDQDAMHIAAACAKSATLKHVQLNSNHLSDPAAICLAALLKTQTPLQILDLDYNSIGDSGAVAMAESLADNASLRVLDLHYNKISHEGAQALAAALEKNSTLRTLSLRGNRIGDEGASHLASALKTNLSLRELLLGENHVNNHGASNLASMLHQNSTLRELHLERNKINDPGAIKLATSLVDNNTLQELWLLDNLISATGVQCFTNVLHQNATLKRLGITVSKKDSSSTGACRSLKWNHNLRRTISSISGGEERINLDNHPLSDEGAALLADAIERSDSLREIVMENCKIYDNGGIRLAEAVSKNSSLERLTLTGSKVGREAAPALAEAVETCLSRSATARLSNGGLPSGVPSREHTTPANFVCFDIGSEGSESRSKPVRPTPNTCEMGSIVPAIPNNIQDSGAGLGYDFDLMSSEGAEDHAYLRATSRERHPLTRPGASKPSDEWDDFADVAEEQSMHQEHPGLGSISTSKPELREVDTDDHFFDEFQIDDESVDKQSLGNVNKEDTTFDIESEEGVDALPAIPSSRAWGPFSGKGAGVDQNHDIESF